jgi:hypothetical protein
MAEEQNIMPHSRGTSSSGIDPTQLRFLGLLDRDLLRLDLDVPLDLESLRPRLRSRCLNPRELRGDCDLVEF